MNTNIVLFRGNVAAPALRPVRANFKANNAFDIRSDAQPRVPVRDVLIAVWHTNPASGRLECRWTTDRAAATDEGVSCSDFCAKPRSPAPADTALPVFRNSSPGRRARLAGRVGGLVAGLRCREVRHGISSRIIVRRTAQSPRSPVPASCRTPTIWSRSRLLPP